MKTILCAALVAMAVSAIGATSASAAPAMGAPLANAAGGLDLQQVWYDRWGRWHPNRPRYVPVCRNVRVCNRYGRCWWTRKCY